PEDGLELRVQDIDLGLDGWVGGDADRPRLVEIGGRVDQRAGRRVDDQAHAREAQALAAVFDQEYTVRPPGQDLLVRVVADDHVDLRDVVREIDRGSGRRRQSARR